MGGRCAGMRSVRGIVVEGIGIAISVPFQRKETVTRVVKCQSAEASLLSRRAAQPKPPLATYNTQLYTFTPAFPIYVNCLVFAFLAVACGYTITFMDTNILSYC